MHKTILKIKSLTGICMLFLFVSFNQFSFAQLPAVADPLYTNPIANPLAIPKFVNQLPSVPRLNYTSGVTADMYMGQGTHDFGLGVPTSSPVFGYSPDPATVPFGYLGPTILAYRGNPVYLN